MTVSNTELARMAEEARLADELFGPPARPSHPGPGNRGESTRLVTSDWND